MKFTFFRLILFSFIIGIFSSCLGSSSDSTTGSSSPYFSSLVFKSNDSIPYLSTAAFTLNEYDAASKDSIIVNLDSLPYGTRIDSVYPTFTFKSSAAIRLYYLPGNKYKRDSVWLTGTDTIDFKQPVRVRNYAADKKTYKEYTVKTNVHQVNPEVYKWRKASDNLGQADFKNQKAITRNDTLFYYQNDGTNGFLSISTNGYSWTPKTLTGLPVNSPLNDMTLFKGQVFVSKDGFNIYSSTNGINWIKKSLTEFSFKSLLFVFNDLLWAVVQANDASYHFANSPDGIIWTMRGTIPDNFPVSDFASVSFKSPTGKERVFVTNGVSADGSILYMHNRWSTEDETGVNWVNFSSENTSMDDLTIGGSVISYDNKLFAFGLKDDNTSYFKVSRDEGLSWQVPDTALNILPAGYMATPRNYQSVVVFKAKTYDKVNSAALKDEILQSNRIFIFGGKFNGTKYSDVWTGKLNRKNFLRQYNYAY